MRTMRSQLGSHPWDRIPGTISKLAQKILCPEWWNVLSRNVVYVSVSHFRQATVDPLDELNEGRRGRLFIPNQGWRDLEENRSRLLAYNQQVIPKALQPGQHSLTITFCARFEL